MAFGSTQKRSLCILNLKLAIFVFNISFLILLFFLGFTFFIRYWFLFLFCEFFESSYFPFASCQPLKK